MAINWMSGFKFHEDKYVPHSGHTGPFVQALSQVCTFWEKIRTLSDVYGYL